MNFEKFCQVFNWLYFYYNSTKCYVHYYLQQGGYVIVVVCLFVCLLAILRKNFQTNLHEIVREGWQWVNGQMTKFW